MDGGVTTRVADFVTPLNVAEIVRVWLVVCFVVVTGNVCVVPVAGKTKPAETVAAAVLELAVVT